MKGKLTLETFIERAREIHGGKYDYSKTTYKNYNEKVCIICPKHGEFWQTPHHHLNSEGCYFCGVEKMKEKQALGREIFIKKAKAIHGGKYDYSKVNYANNRTKVCIICPEHGEFYQTPDGHLSGRGCPKCGIKERALNQTSNVDDFIEKARKVHGEMYDYSKVNYINSQTKVLIKCNKCGNEFWQTPNNHTAQKKGCPYCKVSLLEEEVLNNLKDILVVRQYKTEWLGRKSLDFYIPSKKIGIECQGIQHFEPVEHFGGKENFEKQIENDKAKLRECKNNGVELVYFTNYKIDEKKYFGKVFNDVDKLIEYVRNK